MEISPLDYAKIIRTHKAVDRVLDCFVVVRDSKATVDTMLYSFEPLTTIAFQNILLESDPVADLFRQMGSELTTRIYDEKGEAEAMAFVTRFNELPVGHAPTP